MFQNISVTNEHIWLIGLHGILFIVRRIASYLNVEITHPITEKIGHWCTINKKYCSNYSIFGPLQKKIKK